MKINHNQLAAHLTSQCAAIYCISSHEYFLIHETAQQIKAAFSRTINPNLNDVAYDVFSFNLITEDILTTIINEIKQTSLFTTHKVIQINLGETKLNKNNNLQLQEIVDLANNNNLIIISMAKLPSSKNSWLNSIEERGVVIQIWPLKTAELPMWINKRAKQLQLNLDERAIKYLIYKTEGDLLACQQELEKLSLQFLDKLVTIDDIKRSLAQSNNFDVFMLADTCLNGDLAKTLHILHSLHDHQEEPILILWSITQAIRELHKIYTLQHEHNYSAVQAITEQKVWTKRVPMVQNAIARLNITQVNQALIIASDIDKLIKSGEVTLASHKLTNLLVSLATAQDFLMLNN